MCLRVAKVLCLKEGGRGGLTLRAVLWSSHTHVHTHVHIHNMQMPAHRHAHMNTRGCTREHIHTWIFFKKIECSSLRCFSFTVIFFSFKGVCTNTDNTHTRERDRDREKTQWLVSGPSRKNKMFCSLFWSSHKKEHLKRMRNPVTLTFLHFSLIYPLLVWDNCL